MITQFTTDTALLVIDAQTGVDELRHWGGANGRRNNPQAEQHILELLAAWRARRLPVIHTLHDSREPYSPLKLSLPTGRVKSGLDARDDEAVVHKDVNSGFIGTNLELILRRAKIRRLVTTGFFTNMCVETTVRMAGNLGFDTYLVGDACACTNRLGSDGTDHDPERVHAMTLANLHGEFCTVVSTTDALALLAGDHPSLERVQGNEP